MKKGLLILLMGALLIFTTACGTSVEEEATDSENTGEETNASTETEEANEAEVAIAVVEDSLKYAQEEDLDGYLNTFVTDVQDDKRTVMEETFANFDLEYEIITTDVVIESTATMVLDFNLKTVATDVTEGQEFVDNIATVQYNMNKEDGEWKIYSTEIVEEAPIEE
ncbi:hypothetical protein [Oceanobacillus halophilus]|uniref:Nuclear transport factor 2 family protein n=1 Tax=Oceanobacillus halophilus TaxID=930130 RepID=A0A495A4R9_9BACI|nr:hypothetical protein [Oceanobacillus halophilus]RKQ34701.1 hypothetical protein D8M06_07215 [Oceanobacillus halophilus]